MEMEKEIINVNQLLEWGDSYDGNLPELDPEDYDSPEALEAADEDRRRQYWRLTGLVATSRAAWEAALEKEGVERDSEYWLAAEKVAERFRDLMDEEDWWPVDCHLSYELGDGSDDPFDSVEGAGHYSIDL
jgi:hypothetical protein